jgi:hypothetical protein
MRLTVGLLLACLMLLGTSLLAQAPTKSDVKGSVTTSDSSTKSGKKKTARQANRPGGFTPGREAAALTFVKEHHPELAELLVHLKERHQREYYKAIADLFRVSERLAQTQERDVSRYDHDLKIWKVRSRIELLAAQLRMSPKDEAIRHQLKDSLREQLELQQLRLKSEREKLASRLEKLDSQIENLSDGVDETVERQLNLLTQDKQKRTGTDKSSTPVNIKQKDAKEKNTKPQPAKPTGT